MFVLTFSPLGEKVNTNMALIHRQVKKSTLGKIVNNHPILRVQRIKYWSFTGVKYLTSSTSSSKIVTIPISNLLSGYHSNFKWILLFIWDFGPTTVFPQYTGYL